MTDVDALIRERAYTLWEQSGHVHGSEMEFWLQAEREIKHTQAPSESAAPTDALQERLD